MNLPRYIKISAIVFSVLTCGTPALYADEKISMYTVNDGLSQHSVTSIVQDSKDMLWIGTFDGLNMFDGVTFTNFRHYQGDSTSIVGNRILALANDDEDGLWILFANNCVGKYCGNGRFLNYRLTDSIPDLGNEIKVMKVCDGNLVIEDNESGVLFVRPDTTVAETVRMKALKVFLKKEQDKGETIRSVDFSEDAVWLSSSAGVFCSVKGGKFELVNSEYRGYHLKYARTGYVLLYKDNIFIACSVVRSEAGKMVLHEVSFHEMPSLVQDVSSGTNGEFWVASRDGLSKIADGQIIPYPPASPVRSIYVDNYGVIWNGGLSGLESINPYSEPVYNYRFEESMFSIENHVSTVDIAAGDSEIWVGIMQGGLHLLKQEPGKENGGRFRHIRHFLPEADVTSVCLYSADTVIAGTDMGLKMLVRDGGTFRESGRDIRVNLTGQPFRSLMFNGKMLFSNGSALNSLVFEHGVPHVDSLPEINRMLPQNSTIVAMSPDPDGSSVWIGYRGASVYKVDFIRNSVYSLNQLTGLELSNLYIWDIFFDSRGRLWIGTDAGLNMICKEGSSFCLHTLSVKDGLTNDKIETIEEDADGRIWAGTSQGIVCYDPEEDDFVSYGYEDGFQSNNFTSASDSFSDGTLVFGGIAGFSYFNPGAFTGVTAPPSIFIDRFIAGTRILDIPESGNIKIRSNTSSIIKIKLSSYYSPDPKKVRYLYSINGNEWTEIPDNEIRLSGLSPGRYEISVKSSVGRLACSEVRTVPFVIRRPLMLSVSAFILYFAVLCAVAFMIVRAAMMRKILDGKLKMEESLRENENRANTEMLNFYTNIAHEIKTPLSLILGRIYDIENSGEASPNIVRKAKLIGDNALIIKELTEQVLEFKRAESGKMSCELQRLDIMPHVRKVVDNYMDYAEKRGVSLKLESSAVEIVCNIDLKKFLRIIYNLLSNAIKFSERGDSVEIKLVGKPDCLILTVSDTGNGISEEDLPHIFERFYKSGKAGGSGIGLAFTKSLVELMGGRISVTSRIGEGSTFVVNIPEQKMTLEVMDNKEAPVSVLNDKMPVILLVEDNVELNEYITEILSVKFKVLQAFDGKEAVSMLQNREVDLVVTDIMMPNVDGIEMANKIKNIKQYAHIPIVFLSAMTDPEDQLAGLQTGAVDYITKPFNPHILLVKMQNILSQYYLSKVSFASESAGLPEEPVPVRNKDEIFINKAREIIYKNMSDEEFGVSSLSEEMGISRVHLTREFQRIIGKTPSAFIKGIRLNHAKYLLSSGNYSIKEVLWEIGIRSHSGFTKIYKEEFGVLPSQTKEVEHNDNKITDNEN